MITHLKVATKDVHESVMEQGTRTERSQGDALHPAPIGIRRDIEVSMTAVDIGAIVTTESKSNFVLQKCIDIGA